MKRSFFFKFLIFVLAAPMAHAHRPVSSLCKAWESSAEIGKLDGQINESSGLAVSQKYDHFYHINDSGDGPYFYVTDRKGQNSKKVEIENFKPWDTEDLSLGPCPGEKSESCIYVADIGDNKIRRKNLSILILREEANFPKKVKTLKRLTLKYPDNAHDAEAFSVHPSGDLFIITKEMARGKASQKRTPAFLFRFPADQVHKASPSSSTETLVMEEIGRLDIPELVSEGQYETLVTGMSIEPKGHRFVVLTYATAVEIAIDLTKDKWPAKLVKDKDYRLLPLNLLSQQEAISYDRNGRDVFYSSETIPLLMPRAPLMVARCKEYPLP